MARTEKMDLPGKDGTNGKDGLPGKMVEMGVTERTAFLRI